MEGKLRSLRQSPKQLVLGRFVAVQAMPCIIQTTQVTAIHWQERLPDITHLLQREMSLQPYRPDQEGVSGLHAHFQKLTLSL